MRSVTLILILLGTISSFPALSQLRYSAKVAPGLGYIRSPELNNYYNTLNDESTYEVYNISSRMRTHFAFGGMIDYKINESWFVVAEPVFTFASVKLVSTYTYDDVDEQGNGEFIRINSDAKFRTPYFSLPLTARYRFSPRRELYALGGFVFNINLKPTLVSKEKASTVSYDEGVSEFFYSEKTTSEVKISDFNVFNMGLVAGFGKMLNKYGRNIFIDVRYNLPLTRTGISSAQSDEALLLNSVFTKEGQEYSGKNFKDFRTGLLSLNIGVMLYKDYR